MADNDGGRGKREADSDGDHQSTQEEAPFKRQKELDAALQFIRDSHFGVVGQKGIRPYSAQMKNEAERLFGVDRDIYLEASRLQDSTNRRYFVMRLLTAMLFIIYTVIAYFALTGELGAALQRISPWPAGAAGSLVIIVLTGFILGAVRYAARKYYFFRLEHMVKELSYSVKQRYTNIVNDCRLVAHEIGSMAGAGDWPERAQKSMIVALWHAIRADYLDRYSTTVLWKTDAFFEHTENAFRAFKVLIALALFAALWLHTSGHVSAWILGFALYAAVGWFGWFWFNRQPNDFVEHAFNSVSSGSKEIDESASGPYFFALADEIENLVYLTQSGFFNLPGAKKSRIQ